jgi:hypothetical protein
MARLTRRSPPTRLDSVLLLAAGALGGLVVGALLAERLIGVRGRRQRVGHTPDRPTERQTTQPPVRPVRRPDTDQPADAPPRSLVGREELERRVLEVFQNDPILAGCAIDISAQRGDLVELTGWVAHATTAARAATLAGGVPGVRGVRPALSVRRER